MKRLNTIMLCLSTLFSCAGLTTGCFAAGPAIEQPQALPLTHLQKANKLLISGSSWSGKVKEFKRTVPEIKRKEIISCLARAQSNTDNYDPGIRADPISSIRLTFYFPDGREKTINLSWVESVKKQAPARERIYPIVYILPDEDYQKFRSIIEELIPPMSEWSTL